MLRVASVSFSCEKLTLQIFKQSIINLLEYAKEREAEIVVFPEYIASSLMDDSLQYTDFTTEYIALFSEYAKKLSLYIAAGSHPTMHAGRLENCAYFFSPTGMYEIQPKIHLVPDERSQFSGSESKVKIFTLQKAKVAVLVCYDIEFPELVRTAVHAGAEIILVPTYTTDFQAHCRVTLCARARTIENHIYVVQSPLIGRNIFYNGTPSCYGIAGIYSPCDDSFPPGGIVAQGPVNESAIIFGDLNIDLLHSIRNKGNTTPLKHLKSNYESLSIPF